VLHAAATPLATDAELIGETGEINQPRGHLIPDPQAEKRHEFCADIFVVPM
jgi:hypothetical protein